MAKKLNPWEMIAAEAARKARTSLEKNIGKDSKAEPLKSIRVSASAHIKAKTAAAAGGKTLQAYIESLIFSQ